MATQQILLKVDVWNQRPPIWLHGWYNLMVKRVFVN